MTLPSSWKRWFRRQWRTGVMLALIVTGCTITINKAHLHALVGVSLFAVSFTAMSAVVAASAASRSVEISERVERAYSRSLEALSRSLLPRYIAVTVSTITEDRVTFMASVTPTMAGERDPTLLSATVTRNDGAVVKLRIRPDRKEQNYLFSKDNVVGFGDQPRRVELIFTDPERLMRYRGVWESVDGSLPERGHAEFDLVDRQAVEVLPE